MVKTNLKAQGYDGRFEKVTVMYWFWPWSILILVLQQSHLKNLLKSHFWPCHHIIYIYIKNDLETLFLLTDETIRK